MVAPTPLRMTEDLILHQFAFTTSVIFSTRQKNREKNSAIKIIIFIK